MTKKILWIDDHPQITRLAQLGLTRYGFIVTTYNDPEEAIASFSAGSYDCVICDIRMPKMNGFQVCKQLRRIDGGVSIYLLTGITIRAEEFRMLFPGLDVQGLFEKPVSIKALAEFIGPEIEQRQLLQKQE